MTAAPVRGDSDDPAPRIGGKAAERKPGAQSDSDVDPRFERQARFASIGAAGQRRISEATVLIVGVGALGTHAALALARAGIGRLQLVDRDVVDPSNLQRQVLFDAEDAAHGRPKALAAAAHLRRVRIDLPIDALVADFDAALFRGIATRPDLILDGTDNFATRYLLNDLALDTSTPWIYGGAVGSTGRAAVVLPGTTPCLRCLMPDAPPTGEIGTCDTAGILAPAVAHVAAFQVGEALKILSGHPECVTRGLFHVDVWSGEYGLRLSAARPDPACRSCGTRELPALHAGPTDLISLCGRDAIQVRPSATSGIDLPRLADRLRDAVDELELGPAWLRFAADGCRFSVFSGGRALLFGVTDPARARILYDRWIGAAR